MDARYEGMKNFYAFSRREIVIALKLMQKPLRQVLQTSRGIIEYAMQGEGAAVIICHSSGGGYDQGLTIVQVLDGFGAIAISRHF